MILYPWIGTKRNKIQKSIEREREREREGEEEGAGEREGEGRERERAMWPHYLSSLIRFTTLK